ncbi:hypothetical protein [Methanococcus maripaludis]|uniref:Uncharacterized protein n=1 Tax=Methanococcus maripaludis TaxID=39152 RepID=A0A8T4CKS5_METMI|nr:hypothetical protein [Methanococcus maripaludis]MBM7408765.1 hypothetical protein [Methanococcus maripaludis]MBP2219066.1 hypothetical protein [Methanococcus maripaludis]
MTLKEFSDAAIGLTKNPLGIIGLFITLVYGIAGLTTIFSNLDYYQRFLLIIFIVVFPFVLLYVFYILVTKHHDKLYAPSDFQNEEHFVNLVNKVDNLKSIMDEVQKAVYDQPLYKFGELSSQEQTLILTIFRSEIIDLNKLPAGGYPEPSEVLEQSKKLVSYGWVTVDNDNNIVKITEKGKNEVGTFKSLTVGRFS